MRQFTSDDTSRWSEGLGDGHNITLDENSSQYRSPHTTLTNGQLDNPIEFFDENLVVIEGDDWELNKIKKIDGGLELEYPLEIENPAKIFVIKQYKDLTIGKERRVGSDGSIAIFCTGVCKIEGSLETEGNLYIFAKTIHIPGKLVIGGKIVLCGQVVALDDKNPWEGEKETMIRYSNILSAPDELKTVWDSIYGSVAI